MPGMYMPEGDDPILLKWPSDQDIYASLSENTLETSQLYHILYLRNLNNELRPRGVNIILYDTGGQADFTWAESKLGKSTVNRLRQKTCVELLLRYRIIFIDMPDYSKTDRRKMTKDLESIEWLWNRIASAGERPTIVFAVQKEMSEGHFFLDKAMKFELDPLSPERMVEAYTRRFQGTEPFTERALLKLARMSRGVFRRFLRYIVLALDLWESEASPPEVIDVDLVVQSVPVERLVEDRELELSALFSKHSDLASLAVRLIMLLEERGELGQSEIANLLDVKEYTLSRLLTKLEGAHQVTRTRRGNDNIVSLQPQKKVEGG